MAVCLTDFFKNPYIREILYFLTVKLLRTGLASAALILLIFSVRAALCTAGKRSRFRGPDSRALCRLWYLMLLAPLCGRLRSFGVFLTPVEPASYFIENLTDTGPLFQAASCLPFSVCYLAAVLSLFTADRIKLFLFKRKLAGCVSYRDDLLILSRAAKKVGIRPNMIRCRIWNGSRPPFSFGLCRPFLVLPCDYETRYKKEELEAVFVHELVHIRRGDLWALAVLRLMRCAWWANPLLCAACRVIRRDMELSCDETVLSLGEDPFSYGMAVMRSLTCAKTGRFGSVGYQDGLGITNACEEKELLKRRILGITSWPQTDRRNRSRGTRAAVRALAAAVLAFSIFMIGKFSYRPYTNINRVIGITSLASGQTLLDGKAAADCVAIRGNDLQIDCTLLCDRLEKQGWNNEEIQLDLVLYQKERTYTNAGCVRMADFREHDGQTLTLSFYGEKGLFPAIQFLFFKYL